MKIRPFIRFAQDDYKQAPQWFFTFLGVMNMFVDTLNAVLQNNVDIDNNQLAERQTLAVQHGVPISTKLNKLTGMPRMVRAGYASGQVVTGCSITGYNNDGSVQVTVLFNGAPSGTISTVVVFEP